MQNRFQRSPYVLNKHVYLRSVFATIFLLLFVLVLVFSRDILFAIPCIAVSLFLFFNAGILLYDILTDRCIAVMGECIEVEKTPITKRIKSICLDTEDGKVKVPLRYKAKGVDVGSYVTVYLAKRTTTYEHRGTYVICGYYALEIANNI